MTDSREDLERVKRGWLRAIRASRGDADGDAPLPAFSRAEFCREALEVLLGLSDKNLAGQRDKERVLLAVQLWMVFADELMRPIFEAIWAMIPRQGDDPNSRIGRERLRWMLELPDEMGTPVARDDLFHPTLMIPREYHTRLLLALEALEFGEVQPILSPEKNGKHGQPYTWLRMKMVALRHVWFLQGQGCSQTKARELVHEALSVKVRTLREWEDEELPDQISDFEEAKEIAKKAGQLFRQRQCNPDGASELALDPRIISAVKALQPPALHEFARKFVALNGSRYWMAPKDEPKSEANSRRKSKPAKSKRQRAL